MNLFRVLSFLLFAAFAMLTSAHGEQREAASNQNELAMARQCGWDVALAMIERIESNKVPGFPGIQAFLADFRTQTKGLDPHKDPERWPKVDVDALTTHNPHF